MFLGYTIISAALLLAIFTTVFPHCFIEGVGLTPFKKNSEYLIILVLGSSLGLLQRNRSAFEPKVWRLIGLSFGATIGAELAFTFYVSVYGLSNLVGHFLKLVSCSLIYRAIIVTGIRKPFALLFRNLCQSNDALKAANTELQRAIRKHHGTIWAEGEVGQRASFHFTLFETATADPDSEAPSSADSG